MCKIKAVILTGVWMWVGWFVRPKSQPKSFGFELGLDNIAIYTNIATSDGWMQMLYFIRKLSISMFRGLSLKDEQIIPAIHILLIV